MANRFPLIFNSGAGQIQELAASDNLDLTSSNLVNAGILFTSSGSQTAPSISIGNGTTYPPGLYSPGTDQLAVATNGTGKVFVSSAGLVSIGNSSPGSRLEIGGDASYDARVTFNRVPVQTSNDGVIGELFFQNNADSVALIAVKRQSAVDDAYIQFATQQTSGGLSEKMRLTSAGLLGIGTASPGYALDIASADTTAGNALRLRQNATATAAGIQFTDAGATTQHGTIVSDTSSNLKFATGNTEKLRITSTGTLNFKGAGTAGSTQAVSFDGSAPVNSLVIDSSGRLCIGSSSPTNSANLDIQLDTVSATDTYAKLQLRSGNYGYIIKGGLKQGAGAQLHFDMNNNGSVSTKMVLDTEGRLGIGTGSPSSKLDVTVPVNIPSTGSPDAGSFITARGNTATVGYGPSFALSNSSGAKETSWRISAVTASGNNGDLVFNGYNGGGDLPERMRITAGGLVGINTTSPSTALQVNGTVTATTFQSTSDINLKENIKTVNNSLNIVSQLRGVTFDWKNTHQASIGVIAQEVEQILPELVSGGENKTVNYNGIIGILVEAIKEQEVRIEKLENKLNAQ